MDDKSRLINRLLIKFSIGLLLLATFVSCRKVEYHKIKYQIKFFELPYWYQSNALEISVLPYYQGKYNYSKDEFGAPIAPTIDYNMTQDSLWEYEYWELKKGDRVYFELQAQLVYYYELNLFIDNHIVASKRIKISNQNYFQPIDIKEFGRDNTPGDASIDFIY